MPRLTISRQTLLGYLYSALGAGLFSTKAIFIKLAYVDKPDASLMLALRMVFSLPFFLAVGLVVLWRRRQRGQALPEPRLWLGAVVTGLLGYYLSAWLDFKGLVFITAQLERLVLFTYPVMVMVLGWLWFNGRITWWGSLGAAITYGGLLVVFLKALPEGGTDTIIGTALVLACAFTFALYQLFAKRYVGAMGSLLFTCASLAGCAVAAIGQYVVVKGSFDFSATPNFYHMAAGCAVVATVIPSFLVNAGLSKVSAQATAMISSISPIVTIALAVWILGEQFTLVDALGSALVMLGIVIYAVTDKKPEPEKKRELSGELEPV